MSIDPKVAMYLNIAALILSVMANGAWWGDLVGNHMAALVTGMMTTVVAAVNIVLHAYSPTTAGPMAQKGS